MGDIIIRAWHGALGDSLQHSWIPKYFTEIGHDVYVSNEIPFTNQEIKELVWLKNPYIKGFSNKKPNTGDIPEITYRNIHGQFIMNWQDCHGVMPYSLYPEIYYIPHYNPDLKNAIIIDASCGSLKKEYNKKILYEYLDKYRKSGNFILVFDKIKTENEYYNFHTIQVNSIYTYCDIIFSCKKFVCLSSGGNSLASAIKKYRNNLSVECIMMDTPIMTSMKDQHLFIYPNIDYTWLNI